MLVFICRKHPTTAAGRSREKVGNVSLAAVCSPVWSPELLLDSFAVRIEAHNLAREAAGMAGVWRRRRQ